ncbi:MAG: redoxin domain-containing protein [Planctomycetaceae bacterium]
MRHRGVVWCGIGWMLLACVGGRADEPSPAPSTTVPNPVPLLLRAPAVRAELRLDAMQIERLDALLARKNETLFAFRDGVPTEFQAKFDEAVGEIERGLPSILDAAQRDRLEAIALQAVGFSALLKPEIAGRLRLSESQRRSIRSALESARVRLEQSRSEAKEPKDQGALQKEAARLKAEEHKRIVSALSNSQKQEWLRLVGDQFDFGRLERSPGTAPELRGVTTWLNSDPLTFEDLRGRVVVLNFWAFGCINCVRNLPSYKAWSDDFADRNVTLIGVHTPETQTERDVDRLRAKLAEHRLTYPVAVDNENKNWDAWTNGWWPSTYLVDKRGHVRYWWYGELNYGGAEGEKFMRGKIEELLAEPDPLDR